MQYRFFIPSKTFGICPFFVTKLHVLIYIVMLNARTEELKISCNNKTFFLFMKRKKKQTNKSRLI